MSSPPIIALSSKLLEQIAETIRKRVLSGELIWPAHELIVWHIRADMQGGCSVIAFDWKLFSERDSGIRFGVSAVFQGNWYTLKYKLNTVEISRTFT